VNILVLQHLLIRLFMREKRAADEPSGSDGCVPMNLLQPFSAIYFCSFDFPLHGE
jgi:hypothetical protein